MTPAVAVSALRSGESLARALAWTAIGRWSSQALTWATTLIVARVLSPVDYGIVGMATFVQGAVALVSEFGIGAAAITARDFDESLARQLNTVSLCLGLIGTVGLLLLAPPTSLLFAEPRATPVLAALSVTLFLSALRAVPDGVLQRQQRFGTLAMIDVCRALVQSGVTLALALYGAGYWSLVAGIILGQGASAVLTAGLIPLGVERVGGLVARRTLSFSIDVVGSRAAWYWYSNADFMIAGRILGPAALGAYSLAWIIANIPIDRIGNVVARVALSFFSAVQRDASALRRELLRLSEVLSVVTLPVCLGLAVVAEDLIQLGLGDKWSSAVTPLQLLCAYAPIRVLMLLFPPALMALGAQRALLWSNVSAAVIMPLGFLAASHWGTSGIAAAWVALYPFVAIPQYLKVSRAIQLTLRDYIGAVGPAIVSTAVMTMAVTAIDSVLGSRSRAVILGVDVLSGAAAYVACFLVLFRARVSRVTTMLRAFRTPQVSV